MNIEYVIGRSGSLAYLDGSVAQVVGSQEGGGRQFWLLYLVRP